MTVSPPARTSTTPQTEKASGLATSRPLPEKYRKLVRYLQLCRGGGDPSPNGSQIAAALVKGNSQFYASVGVKKWGQYSSQAVVDGIIVVQKGDKISLREQWMNVSV
jgi:hypothetical protein